MSLDSLKDRGCPWWAEAGRRAQQGGGQSCAGVLQRRGDGRHSCCFGVLGNKEPAAWETVGGHQICHTHTVRTLQSRDHLTGSKSGWNHRLALPYLSLWAPNYVIRLFFLVPAPRQSHTLWKEARQVTVSRRSWTHLKESLDIELSGQLKHLGAAGIVIPG